MNRIAALAVLVVAVLALPLLSAGCPHPVTPPEPALEIPAAYEEEPERERVDWLDTYRAMAPERTGPGAREAGIDRMIVLVRIARALLEGFDVDDSTREFLEALDGGLIDFDVHEIYRSFPHDVGGGTREVVFVGRLEDSKYRFALAEPDDLRALEVGDFYSRVRLTPIEKGVLGESAYALDGEIGISAGELGGLEALAWLVETLGTIERAAGEPTDLATSGGLEEEDWRILVTLSRSYPKTFEWIREFFRIEDLVELPREYREGDPIQFTSRFGPRIEAFEGKYPRLYRFFTSPDLTFRATGVYRDADGAERLRYSLSSQDYLMRSSALLSGGAFLPVDGKGRPVPGGKPFLLPDGLESAEAIYDFEAGYSGLHLLLVGLTAELQLATGEEGFVLVQRYRRPPKVARIDGRLFGVVPDWMMMIDFDELFRDLVQTATQGRGGRGTELALSWRRQAPGVNLLRVRVESELPAEGVLRYLYKFWTRRFLPGIQPGREKGRFQNQFLKNLIDDLEAGKEEDR
ncbi:MAG: hypothetical protein HY720_00250 [Planctomycetes bacterium]|nr:hypothetical protein [Planctomycetota bacterium]